ncbi:MAG: glycoside hydrolase family 5 protein [Bacteroidota bacterium]
MKVAYYLLLATLIACQTATTEESNATADPAEYEEFTLHRGTNISHWLSQSSRRGAERQAFFTKDDVTYLAGLGFDHLRIPIDEEQMFDEAGNPEPEAFTLLTNALDWCREENLRAIVDLHILRSHHFNEDEKPLWTEPAAQEKFMDLWRVLSDSLNYYPTGMLAYELMNEPVADDPENWNQLVSRAVQVIREQEPERVIVIGSNRWQSADTFDELRVPEHDPNILLSFHFYEPFLLTHYQASWTNIANYEGPVHYPGPIVTEAEFDTLPNTQKAYVEERMHTYHRDTLEKMMAKPMRVAQELNLPLYCGEWGVITSAPQEDRLRWYRDMVDIFEANNIAYANWDYKSSSFGLVTDEGEPNEDLVGIVTSGN